MRRIQGSLEEEKFGDVRSRPESEGSWYFYCQLVEREGRSETWVCRVGRKRERGKSSQQVALQDWTGHNQPALSSTQPPLLLLCSVLASSLLFIQKRDVDSSPTEWGLHVPPSFSSFTLLHPLPFPGNFSADWMSYVKKRAHRIRDPDLTELIPSTQSVSFWLVQICRDAAIFCFSQRIGSQAAVPTSQKMREPNLGCLEAWSCLPRPFWDSCKGPGSGWDEEGIHFGYKI